jgi:hypothetical protein
MKGRRAGLDPFKDDEDDDDDGYYETDDEYEDGRAPSEGSDSNEAPATAAAPGPAPAAAASAAAAAAAAKGEAKVAAKQKGLAKGFFTSTPVKTGMNGETSSGGCPFFSPHVLRFLIPLVLSIFRCRGIPDNVFPANVNPAPKNFKTQQKALHRSTHCIWPICRPSSSLELMTCLHAVWQVHSCL